jgi:hypothetical protein
MNKLLAIGLTLAVAAVSTSQAQAFGCRRNCCIPCCTPCCVTYCDKVVTCYKPEWRERQVQCVVHKMVPKEVVTKHVCNVLVPVVVEQQRTCTVLTKVARTVEKEVTCCKLVPVLVKDPCTGCVTTCCKPVTYTQKVQCVVYECLPVQKTYTVKCCSFKTEQRVVEKKCCVMECVASTVMKTERYCVMVPYQKTIKVPVCCHPVCCR